MPTRRGVLAAVATGSVLSSGAVSAAPDGGAGWPTYQGDAANSGVAREATPPGPDYSLGWTRRFDGTISAAPVLVGSSLYAALSTGTLVAVDATTGDVDWRFPTKGRTNLGLAATDDLVFAGTLHDRETTDGTGDPGGTVYAVDRATGTEVWRTETPAGIQCPPTPVGDTVFLGDQGGTIYALDTADGSTRWTESGDASVVTPPSVSDGQVFVRQQRGDLLALAATTGDEQWREPLDLQGFGGPVAGPDRVYVGGFDAFGGHLYALDRSSGEVDWHRSSPTEILVAPALTANRLFVNDGRHLRAMAPETGEESWTRRVGGPGSVTVTTDRVFSLSRPRLDVFERATGSELGHFSMGTEFEWVPVPSSDGLFLALDDGRLVSLTNSGGPSLLALGLGLGGLGLLGLGGYETYRRHRE